MPVGASKPAGMPKTRIMLVYWSRLKARGDAQTQRRLASDLGVALGLVNAYSKSCINKGLVKVRDAPARRYAYYLTPKGFAEKSRLTIEYLTHSFSLFSSGESGIHGHSAFRRGRGVSRLAVLGASDLAEILPFAL